MMELNNTQHKSFFRHLISHCNLHPASGREHHVSDYLLAGIEGCGYKDQIGLLPIHHDDSGWCGCSGDHGKYYGYYWEYGDCLSHTDGMLWGDWNVCTFELLCFFLGKEVVFSKTYPSFLTLKEGSTFLTKPLFPQEREDVTALRCSKPLRSKVGGPKRSSPCCAGWDRLGKT